VLRRLIELEVHVEKILVRGDMNRSFKIKDPAILLNLEGNNVTPLPASSLKGLMRHLACIVARVTGLKEAYLGLFGQELRDRKCFETTDSQEKEGKLVFVNKGVNKNNITHVISPGIMINPVTRIIKENTLWFYQYFTHKRSNIIPIRYEIWAREELNSDEKRLLCYVLNLLTSREIGGRITAGLGRIVDVVIIPEKFCKVQ